MSQTIGIGRLQQVLSLLKECYQDWKQGKLTDVAALTVVGILVDLIKPTETDIKRAKEVVAAHPEWQRKVQPGAEQEES